MTTATSYRPTDVHPDFNWLCYTGIPLGGGAYARYSIRQNSRFNWSWYSVVTIPREAGSAGFESEQELSERTFSDDGFAFTQRGAINKIANRIHIRTGVDIGQL